MARAIVRWRHERFDGCGYPDRLAGEAIPAAARLVAVADVYDALRRRRFHKPALGHAAAVRVLLHHSAGQFDPSLLRALEACQHEFERIYRETGSLDRRTSRRTMYLLPPSGAPAASAGRAAFTFYRSTPVPPRRAGRGRRGIP
jgi:HD-GYP domain-containing protein (c-di-GMP phosphodiesterase class II)